jgi:hypothetical protein
MDTTIDPATVLTAVREQFGIAFTEALAFVGIATYYIFA